MVYSNGILLALLCLSVQFIFSVQQRPSNGNQRNRVPPTAIDIRWCVVGDVEWDRCQNGLVRDLRSDNLHSQYGRHQFSVAVLAQSYSALLKCVPAQHAFECAELLLSGEADIARFSATELYGLASVPKFQRLIPVAAGSNNENCSSGAAQHDCHEFVGAYSVALVSRQSNVKTFSNLRDKRACFGAVGDAAGWVMPIFKLRFQIPQPKLPPVGRRNGERRPNERSMDTERHACPLDLSVASDLFSRSCAPGKWAQDEVLASFYAKRLCASCAGTNSSCLPTVEQNSALKCLLANKGDVAFVSSEGLDGLLATNPSMTTNYGLLCAGDDGELGAVFNYRHCHVGVVPRELFVTSPLQTGKHNARILEQFLRSLYFQARAQYYGSTGFIADKSEVTSIRPVSALAPPIRTIMDYLERAGGPLKLNQKPTGQQLTTFVGAMKESFPVCPQREYNRMRLCVISHLEMEKCKNMQAAWFGAALPPGALECILGWSADHCVSLLQKNDADLAIIDAQMADDYVHQKKVQPIMVEDYGSTEVYAIALAYRYSRARTFKDLNSGQINVCSAGTDSFAGWEAPNKVMKDLGLIASDECYLTEKWAEKFRVSCVPGVRNATVTLGRQQRAINVETVKGLCGSCEHGRGSCKTASEPGDEFDSYYGDVGAMRCLVRKNGDLAFVKSSALYTMINLKGLPKSDPDFDRVVLSDFMLLCPDGRTNAQLSVDGIRRCNLGRVPNRWMVSDSRVEKGQTARWRDLWITALGRGRGSYDWLRTYVDVDTEKSRPDQPFFDLIFNNATVSLRRFSTYDNTSDFHDLVYANWERPFTCAAATLRSFSLSIAISVAVFVIKRFPW